MELIDVKSINQYINYYKFNIWREMKYYEYVRLNILQKKVSPNFINLLLYKIDHKSRINWEKFEKIVNSKRPHKEVEKLLKNQRIP